ncbi:osmoprotectant transport system ATP-binding protein [Nakamurella sp. UYEF19]|uniref:ABC transporter ATP-binding protein n=1 Tax=Nakamurella sp. UYEF19 TaxID=1756392 RepID=UPI003398E362
MSDSTKSLSHSDQPTALGIELENLTKIYPGLSIPAVEKVSMNIPAGDLVVFVGPSGCGKTTTMKMINRLVEPTSGVIRLGGRDVTTGNPVDLRRQIGYVIQSIGLFPHLTIEENIGEVPKMLGWPKGKIAERVREMMAIVGLEPGQFARRYPRQLSGGQQQRVGVARALAADPPVLLMDEPFGATDPITRLNMQREFRKLQQDLGKTVIFVTHDFEEALLLGDRIAVLGDRSRIVQYDTPLGLVGRPADEHVSAFVGASVHVRLLGLITAGSVADTSLAAPGTRLVPGAVTVDATTTLRDTLDRLLGGATVVPVVDATGKVLGGLDYPAIQRAIVSQMAALEHNTGYQGAVRTGVARQPVVAS